MAKKLIMAQYFASVAEYKESVIFSQPKNKVVRFCTITGFHYLVLKSVRSKKCLCPIIISPLIDQPLVLVIQTDEESRIE